MADIIVLDVSPSAAIINNNDASLPIKSRVPGTNHPRFSLKYDFSEENNAYWSWPIPPQTKLGPLLDTAELRLHWTANTTDTNNVQFGVSIGYVTGGEDIDKALDTEVLTTSQGFSGVANEEQVTTLALSNFIGTLDETDSARLVLKIRRNTSVGTPLQRTVELLKSQLNLDFTSKLEEDGVGSQTTTLKVTSSPYTLDPSEMGRHVVVDTNTIAGAATLYIPTDTSTSPVGAVADDGKDYWISKEGPHTCSVDIDPTGTPTTTIRGASTPIPLTIEGDSMLLKYVGPDNVYQLF